MGRPVLHDNDSEVLIQSIACLPEAVNVAVHLVFVTIGRTCNPLARLHGVVPPAPSIPARICMDFQLAVHREFLADRVEDARQLVVQHARGRALRVRRMRDLKKSHQAVDVGVALLHELLQLYELCRLLRRLPAVQRICTEAEPAKRQERWVAYGDHDNRRRKRSAKAQTESRVSRGLVHARVLDCPDEVIIRSCRNSIRQRLAHQFFRSECFRVKHQLTRIPPQVWVRSCVLAQRIRAAFGCGWQQQGGPADSPSIDREVVTAFAAG